jgi:hypothetical protein
MTPTRAIFRVTPTGYVRIDFDRSVEYVLIAPDDAKIWAERLLRLSGNHVKRRQRTDPGYITAYEEYNDG